MRDAEVQGDYGAGSLECSVCAPSLKHWIVVLSTAAKLTERNGQAAALYLEALRCVVSCQKFMLGRHHCAFSTHRPTSMLARFTQTSEIPARTPSPIQTPIKVCL
jgi:hypothetical protein